MLFHKYISLPIFLLSFAIGLFFIYVLGPDNKTIYVYPSPETVDTVLFQDNADNCFELQEKEIKCPTNPAEIFTVPIQA
jgi:hypothetical protein